MDFVAHCFPNLCCCCCCNVRAASRFLAGSFGIETREKMPFLAGSSPHREARTDALLALDNADHRLHLFDGGGGLGIRRQYRAEGTRGGS